MDRQVDFWIPLDTRDPDSHFSLLILLHYRRLCVI